MQAQRRMVRRFPSFYVRLRRGMFWYYLEGTDACAPVEADGESPCLPLSRREARGGLCLRVRCWDRRIAVEFFHVLTDGTGGLCFLKTLVAEYLTLRYGARIRAATACSIAASRRGRGARGQLPRKRRRRGRGQERGGRLSPQRRP